MNCLSLKQALKQSSSLLIELSSFSLTPCNWLFGTFSKNHLTVHDENGEDNELEDDELDEIGVDESVNERKLKLNR